MVTQRTIRVTMGTMVTIELPDDVAAAAADEAAVAGVPMSTWVTIAVDAASRSMFERSLPEGMDLSSAAAGCPG